MPESKYITPFFKNLPYRETVYALLADQAERAITTVEEADFEDTDPTRTIRDNIKCLGEQVVETEDPAEFAQRVWDYYPSDSIPAAEYLYMEVCLAFGLPQIALGQGEE